MELDATATINEEMKTFFLTNTPGILSIYRGCFEFLRQRGFEIHLCTPPGDFLRETAETEHAEYTEVPFNRSWSPVKDFRTIYTLYRLFRKHKPALVVAATPKPAVLGTIAAKLAGVPVRVMVKWGVITEHRKPVVREVHWLADKLASLCATALASCSNSVTDQLVRTGIARRENIYYMAHQIYTQGEADMGYLRVFAPSREPLAKALEMREKFGIPAKAPIIGFVGRLTKYKGIPDLLEAYKKVLETIPEAWLIVVGPYDATDAVPECLEWFQKHPQVVLPGGQWDLAPYYSLFDLFLCPSYREGNPIVVAEASSMGLATIGYRSTGVVDSIEDGKTGTLVTPGDTGALGERIVEYLQRPEQCFEQGCHARRRVMENQLPEKVFEEHYQGYCDMLRKKGIAVPEPVEDLSPIPEIDWKAERTRLENWLAAKRHLMHEEPLDEVCRLFRVERNDVETIIQNVSGIW